MSASAPHTSAYVTHLGSAIASWLVSPEAVAIFTAVYAVAAIFHWRKVVKAVLTVAATVVKIADGDKLARAYAQRITDLAVLLAGRKRLSLREEWGAHLAGDDGHELSPLKKLRAASGFAVAAIRYRLRDASLLTWKPVDTVLKSRPLSNVFVLSPTAAAAVIILRHDGAVEMLRSAEAIAAIGGALYALVRTGRWWRDVKPPEPKARRVKEL